MNERAHEFVRKSAWFHEAKDYAKAEAAARRALKIMPGLAAAHEARGIALMFMKRFTDAELELRRAIALQPPGVSARYRLALVLRVTDRLNEAEREFRALLDLGPLLDTHLPAARLTRQDVSIALGQLLLSQGRYTEGWRYYETRHPPEVLRFGTASDEPLRAEEHGAFPRWAGEDLVGKSILLWPEQGFGDMIYFARYAPLLAQRGARVTMVVSSSLHDLISTLPSVEVLIFDKPIRNPRFDYWIQIGSVPLFLPADTVPADVPYFRADPARLEKWRHRLPAGPRIGLNWKGSAQFLYDAERSMELEQLRPLWRASNASFISLQKGRDETIRAPADQPMLQLGAEIADFADVAAIVSQLDLVISTDTALVHLVGALARPGWVLLPRFHRDWRWLNTGERSPWYPSLRLFGQSEDFKWSAPVEAVATALSQLHLAA
jgi:tetratricopeptide (TPR) repeat protein